MLYAKEGQTAEEDMFSNNPEDTSTAYGAFLGWLGDTITLQGWEGYRAGLDVKCTWMPPSFCSKNADSEVGAVCR